MSYAYLAFFMGFFGSLHCLFMCGPLVFALPNKWVYHIGRITMYMVLGGVLAAVGNSFSIKGWQVAISLVTGGVLVLFAAFHFLGLNNRRIVRFQQKLFDPVVRTMGYWIRKPGGSLVAGALNGLLPCGMIYMALAAALNAAGVWNGMQFMLFFGMGTLPMMLGVNGFRYWIKKHFSFSFARWLPFIWLIMGCWFLLRGANLDIAYLSPLIYPEGAIECL